MGVELWLRAYPRRWRQERSAEVTQVVADIADSVSPLRLRIDLLRGGLVTRLRDRPPVLVYLAYRLGDRRPPRRYDGWLRDDVDVNRWLYAARSALVLQVLVLPVCIAAVWAFGLVGFGSVSLAIAVTVVLAATDDRGPCQAPRRDPRALVRRTG